ncbi:hypothetical protein BBP00_00005352 [Phytophthora kernoviae]|uniref:ClpA/ClpB AAA lid domain-containing protein n=1 Tax=Phytophthora kernoviae TaxID=325452 RepID=A0A3F2RR29_9STRA|nr:hypothetical protein BBP00_00005352 [Phytophthora kernoviae]
MLEAAIVAAAKLADRYTKERFMPDKTIDITDEACANAEKARVNEIRELHDKHQHLQQKAEQASRNRGLQAVADLQYYAIPDVKRRITEAEKAKKRQDEDDTQHKIVEEAVREAKICEVVAQ